MFHAQIATLRAVCHAVDAVLEEHEYGEFLEAGATLARDICCRAADELEERDRKAAEPVLIGPEITYNPRGKE